jgi:hypothetical protein
MTARVRPGGVLVMMTQFAEDEEVVLRGARPGEEFARDGDGALLDAAAFARWSYRSDPTHIVFWARPCFRWAAANFPEWRSVEFPASNVALVHMQG